MSFPGSFELFNCFEKRHVIRKMCHTTRSTFNLKNWDNCHWAGLVIHFEKNTFRIICLRGQWVLIKVTVDGVLILAAERKVLTSVRHSTSQRRSGRRPGDWERPLPVVLLEVFAPNFEKLEVRATEGHQNIRAEKRQRHPGNFCRAPFLFAGMAPSTSFES